MPQEKGVKRRPRIADRDDLVEARWRIPRDMKDAAEQAAKDSGLSEALYIDLLLREIARNNGALPRLKTEQEQPTTQVA